MGSTVVEYVLKTTDKSSPAINAAASSASRLESQASLAGSSLMKLAGAAGIVSPAMGEALRNMGDLADVAEVGAMSTGKLGVSLGSMGLALGVVASAAAFAAMAYVGLTAETRRSESLAELHRKSTEGVAAALDSASASALEYAMVLSGASAADTRRALALAEMERSLRDINRETLALVEANGRAIAQEIPTSWSDGVRAASLAFGDLGESIDRLDGSSEVFAYLTMNIDGLTTSTAQLREESATAMGAMIQQRAAALLEVEATEAATRAKERAAEAAKRQAEAEREAARAAKEAAEAQKKREESIEGYERTHLRVTQMLVDLEGSLFDATPAVGGVTTAFGELANELDRFAPPLSELEQLADVGARIQAAFAGGRIDAAQYSTLMRAHGAMSGASTTGMTTAEAAIGAASNPIGTLASMPGIVGMVTQAVIAASNLDGTMAGVTSTLQGVRANLLSARGGKAIGGFVGDVIDMTPAFAKGAVRLAEGLIDSAPSIVASLARAAPELALAIIETMVLGAPRIGLAIAGVLLDPNFWIDIGVSFAEGVAEALTRLVKQLLGVPSDVAALGATAPRGTQSPGDWWADTWAEMDALLSGERGRASGEDYVSRTGLRLVHKGESISSSAKTNAAIQGGRMRGRITGSGGGIFIEIDAEQLADAFAHHRSRGVRF